MTIEQVYTQYVNVVNRNATNNNVSVDKFRFIQLLNTTTNRYVEWILEKRNEDDIRYISPLLILDKPLTFISKTESFANFELPQNYFDLANLSVFAKKGSCKNKKLLTFEIKSEDIEELFEDQNNKPSFEFRETFYLTNSNNVSVFKTDFEIEKAKLSYYRYPVQMDIAGYLKEDGSQSSNVDPELDDKVMGRIILMAAEQFAANNNDPNNYQVNKDRVNTKS